jgi:GT2 family glycosyltransferase/hydroxymethylpyrimidine pyrophosphatase-like HAD family hydrolase
MVAVGPARPTSPWRPEDPAPVLESGIAPITLLDLELTEAVPDVLPPVARQAGIQVLVRLHGCPLGIVRLQGHRDGLRGVELVRQVRRELGIAIADHLESDGLTREGVCPTLACDEPTVPPCLARLAQSLRGAPPATIIVATRDRTNQLRACLDSLLLLDYPSFEIVVVDNDPSTADTADMIRCQYSKGPVRHVTERHRGLAAAHNRGMEAASGEILAFTDDDVIVDRLWLATIAEAFATVDRVGAVTGLIYPLRLETAAQVLLERHGGFGKGFGLRVFDLDVNRPDEKLFPLTAGQMGSGANMAFDARVLRRLGGFDPALGAGTTAMGGDDLGALLEVILAGYRIVYQPAALVRHDHRPDVGSLKRQAHGYGVGLGAYLTSAMSRHPSVVGRRISAVPAAVAAVFDPSSARNSRRYAAWPDELVRLERQGVLRGPYAYAVSRWQARAGRRYGCSRHRGEQLTSEIAATMLSRAFGRVGPVLSPILLGPTRRILGADSSSIAGHGLSPVNGYEPVGEDQRLLHKLANTWVMIDSERAVQSEAHRIAGRALQRYIASVLLDDLPVVETGPIVALDLDGVLDIEALGFPGTTAAGGMALRALRAHGYRVLLATGRSIADVKDRCQAYGLSGGVAEYGTVIYDRASDRVSDVRPTETSIAVASLRTRLVRDHGLDVDGDYQHIARVRHCSQSTPGRIRPATLRAVVRQLCQPADWQTIEGEGQIDLVPVGADKGRGILALLHQLGDGGGASPPLRFAVGDGPADLPMLALARLPFAPANAASSLRGAGVEVLRSSYQAGLAEAVSRLIGHAPGRCPTCQAPRHPPARRWLLQVLSVQEAGTHGIPVRALRVAASAVGMRGWP